MLDSRFRWQEDCQLQEPAFCQIERSSIFEASAGGQVLTGIEHLPNEASHS